MDIPARRNRVLALRRILAVLFFCLSVRSEALQMKRHLVCRTADYQVAKILSPLDWAFLTSDDGNGAKKTYDQEDTHLQIRQNFEKSSPDWIQFPLLSVHDSAAVITDFAVPIQIAKKRRQLNWTTQRLAPSFVFSRHFGGYASEADILRNVEDFKEALRENEEKFLDDNFYVLSHNRSSVPQNRWNEIWIGLASGVSAPSCNRIFVEKQMNIGFGENEIEDEEKERNKMAEKMGKSQVLEGEEKKEVEKEEEGEVEDERKEEEGEEERFDEEEGGKGDAEEEGAGDREEDEDEEGEEAEEEKEVETSTVSNEIENAENGENELEAEVVAGANGANSVSSGAPAKVAPFSTSSSLALARDVGACSIVEAIFRGNLELQKTFGVLTRPSAELLVVRVHRSPPSSSSSSSSIPCTLRNEEQKRQFTIYAPIEARDAEELKNKIEDEKMYIAEFPGGKGTLKYEFSGRPTDGRVDEAMVALMDEIDCTQALVGQLEMTILTDDKPWNKDVKSEIWVTKTNTIEQCLKKQKEKDEERNKLPASRGISTRSLNIEEDKISQRLSVKSLKNLAHFPWIQTTVSACTVAEAYFKGYLPLQKYKQALEFRGLIDVIPENNTLLLLGMDYRIARQKKPATASECSVATSRGLRHFDVILLLPLTELARFNAAYWPKKEGVQVGKVDDLPFDSVFVKSFHQWPKEKYIGHYVKDLSQNLYRDDKCFQRDKIYVSYAGGRLPWRRLRRNGRHEIWIPGCHNNAIRSVRNASGDADDAEVDAIYEVE